MKPRSMVIFPLVLAGLLAGGRTALSGRQPAPADAQAVAAWLTSHAVPVTDVRAGAPLGDLLRLKPLLANVRVVGLGEATHGTREFFQFKHRMVEFLVKEMGFTVFAIEASYPACFTINEYVLEGKGDPAKALASQGFWTWDTEEVRDMIAWMREYNKTVPPGRRVKFLGYDIQNLDRASQVIVPYLERVAPDSVKAAEAAIAPVHSPEYAKFTQKPAEERLAALARLYALVGYLAVNEARFIRSTSPAEYDLVLQHARVLAQYADAYAGMGTADYVKSAGLRDLYMAENIDQLLRAEKPGTKMIVWAHNGHVSRASWGAPGIRGVAAMGGHLRRMYGDAYYALGFAFNQGGFQSRDVDGKMALIEFTVPPAKAGSVEAACARTGMPAFVVDFRSAPRQGPVADWLATDHPMRSIGSGFSAKNPEGAEIGTVLRDHYDGLFYIDKTTRARPNPTGVRPAITGTQE